MDYRLQSVLNMARDKADREKMRAQNYRDASNGNAEANHEVTIATAVGAQAAYDWTVGQLETFDIEVAGGQPPPQAPVYGLQAEDTGDNSKLRAQLKTLADLLKQAKRNGEGYGWYDASGYVTNAMRRTSRNPHRCASLA